MSKSKVNEVNIDGRLEIDEYDKVIVLCGGNYDRKEISLAYDSLGNDKDLLRVCTFKKRFTRAYICRSVLGIIGICMTVIGAMGTIFGVPIFSSIFTKTIMLVISLSGIIPLCFSGLKYVSVRKLDNDIQRVIKELRKSDPNKKKSDNYILKEFRESVKQTFYDHPASCWRPLEGHVSDAQTAMCLIQAINEIPAKKPKICLIYAGEPYYANLFIDSISFSIAGLKCSRNQIEGMKKLLDRCIEDHTIRYYLTACFNSNFEAHTNRLNHSTYVFGIRFLSQFISDFREEYLDKVNLQKMNICIDEESLAPDPFGYKSRAIEYLFRAASSPEVLTFVHENDIKDTDPITLKITGINYMGKADESSESLPKPLQVKSDKGNNFHLPIKLPIVLAKKSLGDKNPAISGELLSKGDGKTLILAIGGSEQNAGILPFVVNQFWSVRPEQGGVGLNENLFSKSSWNFGTEDLVYSSRRRNINLGGQDLLKREPSGSIKTLVYSFEHVRHDRMDLYQNFQGTYDKDKFKKIDYIGIYGYSAAATKMVSMLLYKELFFCSNMQSSRVSRTNILKSLRDDTDDSLLFYLFLKNPKSKNPKEAKNELLNFWDKYDFINNYSLIDRLIEQIEITSGEELTNNG